MTGSDDTPSLLRDAMRELSALRSEVGELRTTVLEVRKQNREMLSVMDTVEDAATSLVAATGPLGKLDQGVKNFFGLLQALQPVLAAQQSVPPPQAPEPPPAPPITEQEAICLLRALRQEIWAELGTGPGPSGVLRKRMLETLVSERISDELTFRMLVPKDEVDKTAQDELAYLPEIFAVVARIWP